MIRVSLLRCEEKYDDKPSGLTISQQRDLAAMRMLIANAWFGPTSGHTVAKLREENEALRRSLEDADGVILEKTARVAVLEEICDLRAWNRAKAEVGGEK